MSSVEYIAYIARPIQLIESGHMQLMVVNIMQACMIEPNCNIRQILTINA